MVPFVDPLASRLAEAFGWPIEAVSAGILGVGGILVGLLAYGLIRAAEKNIAARTPFRTDDLILRAIAAPAGWTFALLGILAGARVVFPESERAPVFERVLVTGLVVIWGVAAARLIAVALGEAKGRLGGRADIIPLLSRLVGLGVGFVVLLTVLGVWNVNVTPVVASAGILGIALALAAQDTLANFFAGVAIYLDRPYRIGDFVVLEPGSPQELRGAVRDVGLRSTRIVTRDDVLVTVPNSVIANGRVVNESGAGARFRIRIPVSVAYESDLDRVEAVLGRTAGEHPRVLSEPAPRVRVRSFGDSGIRVEVLAWIADPADRGLVVHDLSKAIHAAFRAEGIRIPFPQRDVHMNPPRP